MSSVSDFNLKNKTLTLTQYFFQCSHFLDFFGGTGLHVTDKILFEGENMLIILSETFRFIRYYLFFVLRQFDPVVQKRMFSV